MIPEERFWEKVMKGEYCWDWMGALDSSGYGIFRVFRELKKAHRIAWSFMNGAIPDGGQVLHHCDNPKCVRPDHLFLGTRSINMQDMVTKGRIETKLNYNQVQQIREAKARQVDIAKKFAITQSHVSRLKTGFHWGGESRSGSL